MLSRIFSAPHRALCNSKTQSATEIKLYEKTKIYESYRDYELSIFNFQSGCKTFYGTNGAGQVFFVTYKRVSDDIYILIRADPESEYIVASVPRPVSLVGLFVSGPSIKAVLRSLGHPLSNIKLKRFEGESVLRQVDLRLSMKKFRFGVVMVGQDDIDENEALLNDEPTKCFSTFIQGLGDRITLKGWPHYSGGLDTSSSHTGPESIHHLTICEDEVMFQIAPWIPCKCVVDRKRLIGNNVVNILFLERKDSELKLNSFVSKQTQCLVLVYGEGTGYSCKVYRKQGERYEHREGPFHFQLDNSIGSAAFISFRTLSLNATVLIHDLFSDQSGTNKLRVRAIPIPSDSNTTGDVQIIGIIKIDL